MPPNYHRTITYTHTRSQIIMETDKYSIQRTEKPRGFRIIGLKK
jgi:hypothetical protein